MLNRPRATVGGIIAMLTVCALSSCATTKEPAVERVWPEPPARARIKYIRSIEGNEDFRHSFFGGLSSNVPSIRIKKPYGVFSDGAGKLYVADTAWGLVLVIDFIEEETFFIGAGRDSGRLEKPVNVTVDASGRVYAVDVSQRRVAVYDSDGQFIFAIGGADEFGRPTGIALNEILGRIYISDTARHVVRTYDFEGNFLFKPVTI